MESGSRVQEPSPSAAIPFVPMAWHPLRHGRQATRQMVRAEDVRSPVWPLQAEECSGIPAPYPHGRKAEGTPHSWSHGNEFSTAGRHQIPDGLRPGLRQERNRPPGCHRRHDIALFFVHEPQHFQEWHTARSCCQVFTQEGFGQPIVLALHRLTSQRFERCPRTHQASKSQVEGGKEASSLGIQRIEREQVLQRGRRSTILAGVHLCNRHLRATPTSCCSRWCLFFEFWKGVFCPI